MYLYPVNIRQNLKDVKMDFPDDYGYNVDYNYTYESNDTPHEEAVFHHQSACFKEVLCVLLLVVSVAIFLLGFFGNALVIWISGFKMKKTVNTTWYLSLAISDFVFCAFLPFSIISVVMEEWVFGLFMCKFASSVMFLNMFSSIFLLVVISIDRCVSVVLRTNRMTKSSKPFKVMSALVAAFFVCWLPYHVFILLELNHQNYDYRVLVAGLKVGTAMAAANSFLNPVLYVFMGNDFKRKFKSTVLSKMENAMGDEGRTTSRYLSRSSSVDGRASTHI
ncbi:Chemokine-like receptor 1 [Liparis tanakae]|uniref:Chemokine-like receptor 1 n=1 Tax=Liparis tanakae TaxID=230148 RepID=A0A4Z2GD51_9TELE|nr:Chemokine-like receptor 1 [Liparis tanakae]